MTDTHLHPRKDIDGDYVHIQGSGVSRAILLARADSAEQIKAMQAKYPGRFLWAAGTDAAKPEAVQILTGAVKQGACGLGEIKSQVEADGPEMKRLYALAADLNVPIVIHFQEVPHYPTETVYCRGVRRLEPMLKMFPKTKFIGHGDAFWANISAGYADDVAYPAGPIKPGGLTDRWLSGHPNLFGDLSANSGNNALSRDPEFTRAFLERHQEKLIFGSDCGCSDGHGHGTGQPNNPAAARLAGQCVARATLTLLTKSCSPALFAKFVRDNATRVWNIAT